VVEGSGGGYEVTLSPTFVTVFYLPEPVSKAIGSNQKDFRIDILRDTVVVRPLKNEPGLRANLSITTRKLRINVVLRVGKADEAVSQVIFTEAGEKQEIARKVEEALAPLRAALAEKEKNLDALVRERAQDEIAASMLEEFELVHLAGITRSNDNLVVRVPKAVRLGGDLYVYFAVQNRDTAAHVLDAVTLAQEGREVAGARVTFTPEAGGTVGKVEAGQTGRGIVIVPAGEVRPGRPVELRLKDAKRGEVLAVAGLRI
jgi:hypothetical protein